MQNIENGCCVLFAIVSALATALHPALVFGEAPVREENDLKNVVMLYDAPPSTTLTAAVEARLGEVDARLRLERLPAIDEQDDVAVEHAASLVDDGRAELVVWVVKNGGTSLHLFTLRSGQVVRPIGDVGVEERETAIAIIVAGAAKDLVGEEPRPAERRAAVSTSDDASPVDAADTSSPASEASDGQTGYRHRYTRLGLFAGYSAVGLNSDSWVHGVQLQAEVKLFNTLYAQVGYLVSVPVKRRNPLDPGMEYTLTRHPIRFGLSGNMPVHRVKLSLGLLVCIDPLNLKRSALDGSSGTGVTSVAVSMVPEFKIDVALIDRLSLYAAADLEVQVNDEEYVVVDAEFNVIEGFEVRRLRPLLSVGVSVKIL